MIERYIPKMSSQYQELYEKLGQERIQVVNLPPSEPDDHRAKSNSIFASKEEAYWASRRDVYWVKIPGEIK